MAASTSTPASSTWLLDSGANSHVTSDLGNLQYPKKYRGTDQIGGISTNSSLPISHIGSNTLRSGHTSFKLKDILYCPSASTNLLSIYKFSHDNNCYLLIYPDFFIVKDIQTGKILFRGNSENGMYPLHLHQQHGLDPEKYFAFVDARVSAQIWHFRLGHTSFKILSRILSNKVVPVSGSSSIEFCQSCQLGKNTKLPFHLSNSVSNNPLELIHSYVWSCSTLSVQGSKYYVLFVNDYSFPLFVDLSPEKQT